MPRNISSSESSQQYRSTADHRLRRHRNVLRPRCSADSPAAGRRHPLRPQHYRRRPNLQAAQRLPGLRLDPALHRRGHGRRPRRPLSQRHRPNPFRCRCLRHRRSQAFPQARQSDRRILPDVGIQYRFRSGGRPRIRSLEDGHEFPRRFCRSQSRRSSMPANFCKGLRAANVVGSAQALSRPRRSQPRYPPGTSVHQQVVEEDLGRRLVSLPNAAP